MSAVVGCDLSSHALDLVKLNEDDNRAEWVRCELSGANAWERTLRVHAMIADYSECEGGDIFKAGWWEDVYLVAIEAPYGRGQAGTSAILNRVVGAVAVSLPAKLRCPERCWIVRPDEWKHGLGLKGKPTVADMNRLAPDGDVYREWGRDMLKVGDAAWQNARDAYCLALWARDTNARAVAAALPSPLPAAEENP